MSDFSEELVLGCELVTLDVGVVPSWVNSSGEHRNDAFLRRQCNPGLRFEMPDLIHVALPMETEPSHRLNQREVIFAYWLGCACWVKAATTEMVITAFKHSPQENVISHS